VDFPTQTDQQKLQVDDRGCFLFQVARRPCSKSLFHFRLVKWLRHRWHRSGEPCNRSIFTSLARCQHPMRDIIFQRESYHHDVNPAALRTSPHEDRCQPHPAVMPKNIKVYLYTSALLQVDRASQTRIALRIAYTHYIYFTL